VGTAFVARANGCDRLRLSGEAWREAIAAAHLRDAVVVHLAARVHEPGGRAGDFDRDNVGKTVALAEAAASAGAARFVFASTVKVHGEETQGSAFRADSPAAPADAYARSKWKAEESLRAISARTGMPLVVVRFPLAYGPGVAGNFRALLRLADSGTWLPLAAIENRRSLVHVRDLAEALLIASTHRAAPGRAFIAAHPEAVSTPGLVAAVRAALGRPSRLFRFPPALLEAGASVLGLGSAMRRLTRSLEADPGPLVSELGWQPRLPLPAGLVDTVGHWRKGAG
jgi:nucleoside-diphosphate-sugar epimerase